MAALRKQGINITADSNGNVTITGPNAQAVAAAQQQFTDHVKQNVNNAYLQDNKDYQTRYYQAMVIAGQNMTILPGETQGDYLNRLRQTAYKIAHGTSVASAVQLSPHDQQITRMASKNGYTVDKTQQQAALAAWQQAVQNEAVNQGKAVDNAVEPAVKRTEYAARMALQCVRQGGSAQECGKVRSSLLNLPLSRFTYQDTPTPAPTPTPRTDLGTGPCAGHHNNCTPTPTPKPTPTVTQTHQTQTAAAAKHVSPRSGRIR